MILTPLVDPSFWINHAECMVSWIEYGFQIKTYIYRELVESLPMFQLLPYTERVTNATLIMLRAQNNWQSIKVTSSLGAIGIRLIPL